MKRIKWNKRSVSLWAAALLLLPCLAFGAEDACFSGDASGKKILNRRCVSVEPSPALPPGLALSDLGNVAVAVFGCDFQAESLEKDEAQPFCRGAERQDITGAFTRALLAGGVPLVERTPQAIDKILAEQKFATSGLVDGKSAVHIGKLLGARTLIAGVYNIQVDMSQLPKNEKQNFIFRGTKAVRFQSVRVRAIDLQTGKILFDVKTSVNGAVAPRPLPRLLAAYTGKIIVESLHKKSPADGVTGKR